MPRNFFPYVGITDFTSQQNVLDMLSVFLKIRNLYEYRRLMVGTMMSYKTLRELETKWKDVFPTHDQLIDIYRYKQEFLLNTLHYADYENLTSVKDLTDALMMTGHRGPFCTDFKLDAVQLDMIWPDKTLIKGAIQATSFLVSKSTKRDGLLDDLKVILQVGSKAMDRMGNEPKKVASKIHEYGDSIHCVLLDKSGGTGKEMDTEVLKNYLYEIRKTCPYINLAVAGGLGPKTMHLLKPIIEEFPDISIDAQGRLRRSHSALDPIDWNLAGKYLQEAGEVLPGWTS